MRGDPRSGAVGAVAGGVELVGQLGSAVGDEEAGHAVVATLASAPGDVFVPSDSYLAAMAGNYLSSPEANAPDVKALSQSVLEAIGDLATPTLLVFKLRRLGNDATDTAAVGGSAAIATPTAGEGWNIQAQDPATVRVAE